jgi:hypothetical protein
LLSDHSQERASLESERHEAIINIQRADSQIIAMEELLKQYGLLSERYRTDLERLDFISEGAHFFESLQEVRCPLCDQLMSPDHSHKASQGREAIYQAARAQASKIRAHKKDLERATETLIKLRLARESERDNGQATTKRVDARIEKILGPKLRDSSSRLDQLVARRVELEAARNDEAQASGLREIRGRIQSVTTARDPSAQGWEPLPSKALRDFCVEVEAVLKEWKWEGEGRVEFDEAEYDIKVDGQRRQSHGKGVRAVLYSAFAIGLLRYCQANDRPHPGTIVIDSPLTSYKKGKAGSSADGPVDTGMEVAFWQSLRNTKKGAQIIIIENKEPPADVARAVSYEWFAGKNVRPSERKGFIPS